MFNSRPAHRVLRIVICIALPIACSASTWAAKHGSPDDLFTRIFDQTVARQRSIHTVRAHFTETTTSSLLVGSLAAHGTIIGTSTAHVLMTYTDPEPKTIAIDDKTLTIVWSGRSEREHVDVAETQKRVAQYFTHATVDELRSMFTISAAPDASLLHADRIEMTATRKQIKTGLERLDLWIDRDTALLLQMRLTFPGGDQKTIAFDDITVNVPVTDDMFRIR